MSDRSRSSFRAKTQALQVYLQNAPHPKNVFAIFFLQLFSTRVELSSHGVVVFFFSSSVKIDRNIHACVYVCALRPPREASMCLSFWYLARSQKECLLYNSTSFSQQVQLNNQYW